MATEYVGSNIQCYYDSDCTEELEFDTAVYILHLGPETGFNGTDGENYEQHIYIKNTGDTKAEDVTFSEVGDNSGYFKLSALDTVYANRFLSLGTINPGSVIEIKISSYIPENVPTEDDETSNIKSFLNFTITYNSTPLPDDTVFYVDNKNEDTVKLTGKSTYQDKTFEEYSIINALSSSAIEMRPPVKIFHGSKQELLIEEGSESEKKYPTYKMRLQCSHCGTWTPYFDREGFNPLTTIKTCSKCGLPVQSAVNTHYDLTGDPDYTLNKYKIIIKEADWVYDNTLDDYTLQVDFKGIVLDVYKFISLEYRKVDVNIVYATDHIILEALKPFTGYLILVSEETVKEDNPISPSKSYGFGPYDFPGTDPDTMKPLWDREDLAENTATGALYGQESLIHIKDRVNIELPILGQKNTMIDANYNILLKYRGKEANLEDVQTYYTEKYMALACYDGPALPLWLDKIDGEG